MIRMCSSVDAGAEDDLVEGVAGGHGALGAGHADGGVVEHEHVRLTFCWTADSSGVMPPWEKVESPMAATAGV